MKVAAASVLAAVLAASAHADWTGCSSLSGNKRTSCFLVQDCMRALGADSGSWNKCDSGSGNPCNNRPSSCSNTENWQVTCSNSQIRTFTIGGTVTGMTPTGEGALEACIAGLKAQGATSFDVRTMTQATFDDVCLNDCEEIGCVFAGSLVTDAVTAGDIPSADSFLDEENAFSTGFSMCGMEYTNAPTDAPSEFYDTYIPETTLEPTASPSMLPTGSPTKAPSEPGDTPSPSASPVTGAPSTSPTSAPTTELQGRLTARPTPSAAHKSTSAVLLAAVMVLASFL